MNLVKGEKVIVTHMGSSSKPYDYAVLEVIQVNKKTVKLSNGATIESVYSYSGNDAYGTYGEGSYAPKAVGVITGEKFSTKNCFFCKYSEEYENEMSASVQLELDKRNIQKAKYEKIANAKVEFDDFEKKAKKELDDKMAGKWIELVCSKCSKNLNGYCNLWKCDLSEFNGTNNCSAFDVREEG